MKNITLILLIGATLLMASCASTSSGPDGFSEAQKACVARWNAGGGQ